MRRMFYRWLNAARTARHRRLLLQQKEEELKLTVVAGAWDKWRERYLDIRLQPLADTFLLQSQKNLVFRAFGIWHSKTKVSFNVLVCKFDAHQEPPSTVIAGRAISCLAS
jgi:protein SFI1